MLKNRIVLVAIFSIMLLGFTYSNTCSQFYVGDGMLIDARTFADNKGFYLTFSEYGNNKFITVLGRNGDDVIVNDIYVDEFPDTLLWSICDNVVTVVTGSNNPQTGEIIQYTFVFNFSVGYCDSRFVEVFIPLIVQ